jgi:hypothetical protein
VRSWTIIVSAGLHVLAAVALAHAPAAADAAITSDRSEDTIVSLEVSMIEPPAPVVVPEAPLAPQPEPEAELEAAPAPSPLRRPEPNPASAPPLEIASLAPSASVERPGPDSARSLHMRGEEPGNEEDEDGVIVPGTPGKGPLDLRVPPAGEAAHDFGLQVGAPLINMHDPFADLHEKGDSPVGHHVGGGRYEKKTLQFRAKIDPDGKVHFGDSPFFTDPGVYTDPEQGNVGFKVGFDITDALMRAHGMDPYWSAKLKYLEETSDERNGMAVVERGAKIRESMRRMPAFLDGVWRDARYSAAQRRQVLFELWDECAEDGPDDIVRAGSEVRVTIESFVRRHLPLGSADAFADDELARLNAKRSSKSEFRPYTAAP